MQFHYGPGIWGKRTNRTGIDAAYRRSALRVISPFRTVSTHVVVVIARMMPLKLMDVERRKHDARRVTDISNPVK